MTRGLLALFLSLIAYAASAQVSDFRLELPVFPIEAGQSADGYIAAETTPPGPVTVMLSSSNPAFTVPAAVTTGPYQGWFKIATTVPGSTTITATLPASLGGASLSKVVTAEPPHNLALSVVDTPDPAVPGQPLTYTATVTNPGPADAFNVELWLHDYFVKLRSAVPSQGTCGYVNASSTLRCRLGTIAAGGSASATMVVIPEQPQTVSSTFDVDTMSPGPVITMKVETTVAGDFRFTGFDSAYEPSVYQFYIQRLNGIETPATLRIRTVGTDQGGRPAAVAGVDFAPLDQTVEFAAGENGKSLTLTILDDSEIEPHQELDLLLTKGDGTLAAMWRLTIVDAGDQPTLQSVTPTSAAPGATVTLRGTSFRADFNYYIGQVAVVPRSVTSTEVVLVVPHLPPGQVFVSLFPPGVTFGPGKPLTILSAEPRRRRSSHS